jgi:hypothetical protein
MTLPASLTTIGNSAFYGCTSLTTVIFKGTIAEANFGATNTFPGDLRDKYLDLDGGPGTYTRMPGYNVWTKQP